MDAGEPEEVVGGDRWGATTPTGAFERRGALRRLVLHHTAIRDPALMQPDFVAEATYMRRLEHLHLGRGWLAIGYHFVIMPSGRVFSGRPTTAQGAHASGNNHDSLGIALAGNFEDEMPEAAAIRSLRALSARLAPPGRRLPLLPHGDLMPTRCPGTLLRVALGLPVRQADRSTR